MTKRIVVIIVFVLLAILASPAHGEEEAVPAAVPRIRWCWCPTEAGWQCQRIFVVEDCNNSGVCREPRPSGGKEEAECYLVQTAESGKRRVANE